MRPKNTDLANVCTKLITRDEIKKKKTDIRPIFALVSEKPL